MPCKECGAGRRGYNLLQGTTLVRVLMRVRIALMTGVSHVVVTVKVTMVVVVRVSVRVMRPAHHFLNAQSVLDCVKGFPDFMHYAIRYFLAATLTRFIQLTFEVVFKDFDCFIKQVL